MDQYIAVYKQTAVNIYSILRISTSTPWQVNLYGRPIRYSCNQKCRHGNRQLRMLQVFLISCDITHAHMQLHAHMQTHTYTQVKPTEVCLHEVTHTLVKYCHLEMCACANALLL